MTSGFVMALAFGVLATGACASATDLAARRIPNVLLAASLLYAATVLGLGAAASDFALLGQLLRFSLFGALVGGLLLMLPYRQRQVGAGDVKLLVVFGFYLGPVGAALSLLNGALLGGLWALWISLTRQGGPATWRNLRMMARSAWLSGFSELNWDLRSAGAVTMPYGVALSAGAGLVALWQIRLQVAP